MKKESRPVQFKTIGTLKGGVGKTTILYNIVGELASRNYKILVVDCDPQGNNTANFSVSTPELGNTTNNMFLDTKNPQNIVVKGVVEGHKIDLIPSNISLTEVDMQLIAKPGRERILLKYINENYDFFNSYDYVFFDTNPSMSCINQNCFVVADDVIMITEASVNSIAGAELFIHLWEEITNNLLMENNISALIINKFEKNQKSTKDFISYLEEDTCKASKIVINSKISKAVSIKDYTEIEGIPVSLSTDAKLKKAQLEFKNLVDELFERGVL